jgi:hypothetical protein
MIRRGFLVFVAALALVACPRGPTFIVQQYDGPKRSEDTIAIVRVTGKEPVRLVKLDAHDVAAPVVEDARLHFEILPGRHSVVAVDTSAPQRNPPVAFEAQPGRVYRVVFEGMNPRVHEVDRESDALGPDVTIEEAPPKEAVD